MSTFIVNAVYALGLFSSVFLVFCWGEMAGIARGSDKTAVGGESNARRTGAVAQ